MKVKFESNGNVDSDHFLRDSELSLQSKGFLASILSLRVEIESGEFKFEAENICIALGIGKDRMYSIFSELISRSFLIREKVRRNDGTLGAMIYTFHSRRASN